MCNGDGDCGGGLWYGYAIQMVMEIVGGRGKVMKVMVVLLVNVVNCEIFWMVIDIVW